MLTTVKAALDAGGNIVAWDYEVTSTAARGRAEICCPRGSANAVRPATRHRFRFRMLAIACDPALPAATPRRAPLRSGDADPRLGAARAGLLLFSIEASRRLARAGIERSECRLRGGEDLGRPVARKWRSGFRLVSWYGLMAPAGTPTAVLDRVHQAMRTALLSDEVRNRMEGLGAEVAGSTPAEFAAELRAEFSMWADVIRTAKIKVSRLGLARREATIRLSGVFRETHGRKSGSNVLPRPGPASVWNQPIRGRAVRRNYFPFDPLLPEGTGRAASAGRAGRAGATACAGALTARGAVACCTAGARARGAIAAGLADTHRAVPCVARVAQAAGPFGAGHSAARLDGRLIVGLRLGIGIIAVERRAGGRRRRDRGSQRVLATLRKW